MEGERGATRSIIDEFHPWDFQEDQVEGESEVSLYPRSSILEVSLMSFILRISKEIKWKVKEVLLEV